MLNLRLIIFFNSEFAPLRSYLNSVKANTLASELIHAEYLQYFPPMKHHTPVSHCLVDVVSHYDDRSLCLELV